ncbi:DNA helicase [Corynebacterium minutissimum]|uniref:DNA helicase n=2 Tax=Corynebacterium minutissimum TaxID=38301 RepID=A0A376CWX7_9CORY|nr:DNA helicase [Corynebacterium minutissimum]
MPTVRALFVALVVVLVAMAVSGVLGRVGLPFALIFGLGSLAVTWLVETRGLYMTVISLPLLYAVGTVGAGFITSTTALPEGASPFSKTALLTSAFPLVQHFPVLIVTVLACALLAVLRAWRSNNHAKSREAEALQKRRADIAADQRNRSERLSVAELVARENTRVRERNREERRRRQAEEREKRRQASPTRMSARTSSALRPNPRRKRAAHRGALSRNSTRTCTKTNAEN